MVQSVKGPGVWKGQDKTTGKRRKNPRAEITAGTSLSFLSGQFPHL